MYPKEKLRMEKVIKQVQSNWSKDLIIRFLYIKLAPYFSRDLLYFLADDEEKERQYKMGFINRFPHVVCSTLADFYVDLFNQFDIEAKKIVANSAKIPLFAVIVKGDYGWYFLDPISDLFYNQYGLKPYFFGVIPHYKTIYNEHSELVKLTHEYVNELDKILDINYVDIFFEELHQILTNRKSANEFFGFSKEMTVDLKERKLQLYNGQLINQGKVNGPFERAQLYKFLNDRILNRSEKRYVKVRLVDGTFNPHISLELINLDRRIFYEEEKENGRYVLTKKFEQKN